MDVQKKFFNFSKKGEYSFPCKVTSLVKKKHEETESTHLGAGLENRGSSLCMGGEEGIGASSLPPGEVSTRLLCVGGEEGPSWSLEGVFAPRRGVRRLAERYN